jgi:hypothetical protein
MNKVKKIGLTSKGGAFLDILRKKDEENPPKKYENDYYILSINEETGNYMAMDKINREIMDFIDGFIVERKTND